MRLPDPEFLDHSLGNCAICMDVITAVPPVVEEGDFLSTEVTWVGAVERPEVTRMKSSMSHIGMRSAQWTCGSIVV